MTYDNFFFLELRGWGRSKEGAKKLPNFSDFFVSSLERPLDLLNLTYL